MRGGARMTVPERRRRHRTGGAGAVASGWLYCCVVGMAAAMVAGAAGFVFQPTGWRRSGPPATSPVPFTCVHTPREPPSPFATSSRDGDDKDGTKRAPDPLLSRRELLIPALLSLGSGIAILTNGIRDERAYDAEHKALFAAIESPSFRRILEVGIGEGPNVQYYPPGSTVTGIDPYLKREALTVAQRKAQSRDVDLRVEPAAAEALPFPDGMFDAVISTLVFCTVRDPTKALQEVSRVLRPGGKFVFVEHIIGEEGSFLRAQHEALNPLQQLLAGGCHLTRETDRLFVGAAAAAGSGGALFSRVERLDYLEQGSKWPVVRQIGGVLVK